MSGNQPSWRETLLLYVGYAAFFSFCFLLFAYLTFPYDRVRDHLELRAANLDPPVHVEIGELGPHWLTGVTLTDVHLLDAPGAPEAGGAIDEGDEGDDDSKSARGRTRLSIDELTVSVSPLSLLMGAVSVDFEAEAGEGSVEGSYAAEEKGPTEVQAELEELDLGKLGVGAFLGVPFQGRATGTIDVTLAPKPAETAGEVDLVIDGVVIGDGKSKVPMPGGWGGVTLPPVGAGKLTLQIEIAEGVATISKLASDGKDVQLSGSGSVRLARPMSRSRADLTLGIKVDPAFAKREAKVGTVMNMPAVKKLVGADGMIRLGLTGLVSSLRARPAAGGGSRGKGRPRRPPRRPE
ncbi:MAG: type II secretion system protein GspN [Myxococcales bacterium]|jgi:type II secretion system protein N